MRPKLLIVALILIIATLSFAPHSTPISFAATAVATQSTSADCRPSDLVKAANALKSTGDNTKDMAALVLLESQIGAMNAACAGLKFKGGTVNKLVGPLNISAGTYKATVTTPGNLILHTKALSGDCQ